MHIGDLDLNLIPILDALLKEGSVSRAADQLGLTQSAMSHALRRLRTYFDDPLFVRVAGGMAPTPKAQELAPVVAGMMDGVRGYLLPGAGFNPAESTRTFSLAMSDLAELAFMPRLIERLRKEAPGVRLRTVRVLPRDAAQALERRDADIAVGSSRLTHEGLYQQQLTKHELVCVVSADDPRFVARVSLEDYLAADHIGINPFGLNEDIFEWALQEYDLHRKFFMMTQGFLSVPQMVAGTDLVATVPVSMQKPFAVFPGIRFLPPPIHIPGLVLRQTWHPRFHHDPANIWLRQTVFELFSAPEEFALA